MPYNCGVLNCGNGNCVHKLLDENCPYCGKKLVLVKHTGYKFCSNNSAMCEYDYDPPNVRLLRKVYKNENRYKDN